MKLVVISSIASFVAAFVAASWVYRADTTTQERPASAQGGSAFDAGLPVQDRVAALERAVSDERFARQLLQEEVFYLTSELDRLSADSDFAQGEETSGQADDESGGSRESRREAYRRRNSLEGRMERLIEAGFLPSHAAMIVQRESELQMESIKARYEAERSGDMSEYWRSRNAMGDALREELGDADYERYLVANDRSTSVTVSSVIESSPAQTAGLQAGDEILRYDGERVFSMTDLTRQTMDGTAGQNVVVDIMRDGTMMQVVLPRGPVGITGGRRGR
jgi:hypothetical protein